jgi:hypothetical protein
MKSDVMVAHYGIHYSTFWYFKQSIKPLHIVIKLSFGTPLALIKQITYKKYYVVQKTNNKNIFSTDKFFISILFLMVRIIFYYLTDGPFYESKLYFNHVMNKFTLG